MDRTVGVHGRRWNYRFKEVYGELVVFETDTAGAVTRMKAGNYILHCRQTEEAK